MSDELRAVVFTALGAGFVKVLDVVIQWINKRGETEKAQGQYAVDSGKFTWDMAQSLMSQYKADIKEVRAEMAGLRIQLAERDAKIDTLETQVSTLQREVDLLTAQNTSQNRTIADLRGKLDAMGKTG